MPLDPKELLSRFNTTAAQQGFSSQEITPEIPAYTRPSNGPTVLLSSGIHGDEPAGPLAALAFLENSPSSDFNWLVTPLLNPTGIALGTRENAEGLDLNRDYHHPRSPEIQAHLAWLAQQPTPDLFISLHEDYDATGFYFYEIQLAGRPTIHPAIFEKVSAHLPIEPGPLIDGRESTGDGWFFKEELPDLTEFTTEEGGYPEALFLSQKGCSLSLTFETPTHAAPLETRVNAHLAAIEATMAQFRNF
ncbi:MAG: M14 family metallopeptidase [Roseibacillus sp.]